jgi:hypothetical protein
MPARERLELQDALVCRGRSPLPALRPQALSRGIGPPRPTPRPVCAGPSRRRCRSR